VYKVLEAIIFCFIITMRIGRVRIDNKSSGSPDLKIGTGSGTMFTLIDK
jgi:hypothetical protein